MKKIITLIMVVVVCFSFVACSNEKENNNDVIVTMSSQERYEVVEVPKDEGLIIISSATDNNYDYYVLDLGYVKCVPISSGTAIEYNGQTPINVSFEKSIVTENSISNSLTKAVNETIQTTSTGSAKFAVSQKFKYFIGETDVGVSYSRQWGTTEERSNSTSNTYETATSKAESLKTTVSYTTGENNEKAGVYRLSLVGSCDVYGFVKISCSSHKIEKIVYTFSAREDTRLKLEYDSDGSFLSDKTKKITAPDDACVASLPKPTTVINESDVEGDNDGVSTTIPLVVFNKTVRKDEYKIRGSGNYTLDEIVLNKDISSLKSSYTKLKFDISYELKEVDNCEQYISLYTSTNYTVRTETINHGGSSKNTNWSTYYISCEVDLNYIDSNMFYFKCQAENAIFKDFYIRNIQVKVLAK